MNTAFQQPHFQNAGESQVGQQIGANYGETTFHYGSTTYNYMQGDSPAKKYEVAINHLEGGLPREAEKLFAELIDGGNASTRVAYYYALAVLSDRPLNDVRESVFNAFDKARKVATSFADDEWRAALAVVAQLMSCVWKPAVDETQDDARLRSAISSFTVLAPDRQAEITRHLALSLGGAVQDRLDGAEVKRVMRERLERDRKGRAWLFFQPEPAAPRLFTQRPFETDENANLRLAGGALLFLVGLLTLLLSLREVVAWFALPFLAAGGYLFVRHGIERQLIVMRLKRKDVEHGIPLLIQPPVSPGHWVSTEFVKEIHQRVDFHFGEQRPHFAGYWDNETKGIREYLKFRFVTLYGNAQVSAAQVDWLIRWHARQVAVLWRAGTLFGYRASFVPSQRLTQLCYTGAAIFGVGLVLVFLAARSGGVFAAAFLGGGGFLLASAATRMLAARREVQFAQADSQALFDLEQQALVEWQHVLADRPKDTEMAKWLDLDKSFLRTTALNRCGLTNRDLIAYVVMTEGKPGGLKARVLKGPMRYSGYVVLVFLLTEGGVREVEVDLDFLDGAVHDERRTAFSYEKLGAAKVSEVGVRVSNDRYVVQKPGDVQPMEIANLRSRVFRLTLIGGDDITVVVENFKGVRHTELEDETQLQRIAMHASGISGAMGILEAIAAEGRDWITRERERRLSRFEEWQEHSSTPRGLGGPGFFELLSEEDDGEDGDEAMKAG